MPSIDRLPDRHSINLMGTSAEALAHPVMISVTGAGAANVYFALGNYTAPGNDKNKQCLHGWGL